MVRLKGFLGEKQNRKALYFVLAFLFAGLLKALDRVVIVSLIPASAE